MGAVESVRLGSAEQTEQGLTLPVEERANSVLQHRPEIRFFRQRPPTTLALPFEEN
jgi:hypothetical protein